MATAINTIKGWFTTGKFPTQAQFWAWIDAFRHKDDKVPAADIEGLTELLSPVNEHFNDPNAHSDLFANFAEINTILEDKGFVKTSESFTPNSGTRWNLKGQVFTNEVSIEMPISLCSTGFIRIDRVVLDMNNQFVYVIGDEFTENPVPKALPANTLDYTLIPVNDTEVGDPSFPVIGDIYQEKKYDLPQNFNGSGSDVVIELNQLGRRVIILSGPITSIKGMKMSPPYGEYPHDGKIFVFINQTGQPVTLRHYNTDTDFFFYLKNEIDLVFPPGERIEFMLRSGVLEEHLRSWESELLGEINLPAYSSARNDGANPNNKVLNVDASGNLKLYTMPVMPPPYLEELIPDSYMPSTTGNFIIKGSFFTPSTTVTVEGQTLNYLNFVSDNEMLASITTGATEGTFDVTINNGTSVVFADALLIVLGDVFTPTEADWENITGSIDLSGGDSARVSIQDVTGSATTKTSFFELPATGDFIVQFNFIGSPLEDSPNGACLEELSLVDSVTNAKKYGISPSQINSVPGKTFIDALDYDGAMPITYVLTKFDGDVPCVFLKNHTLSIKRVGTTISFYNNNVYKGSATTNYAFPMKLKASVKELDVENIKIIIPF